MIVRAEAFLRRLRRLFSRDEWMARLLYPGADGKAAKPGLVLIQIDGLGLAQFDRALREANLPFLSRLLEQEGYIKYTHYSGVPSNTPAVQGMLFYGVKTCVPAFSFKDSRSGQVFNMFAPECASAVEQRIQDNGPKLLEGGSAYGNIFTGGAQEAHFCASAIGWGSLLKAANPFGFPLTILLNLHIFIRALVLMVMEFFLALFDSVRGIISGRDLRSEIGFIPLRVAVCVLLREVIATGAKIDIARGLPVIHVNFAGFDEQAHHRGPTSTFAHWSLRGIDSAIEGIWRSAQRARVREYDFFVFSDHGQEDAVGYQESNGRSIHEAVNKVFEQNLPEGGWRTESNATRRSWRADLMRSRSATGIETQLSMREAKRVDTPRRVLVTAMGSVAHIYPPDPLSIEKKERIAGELVLAAKIPIVLFSDGPGKSYARNEKGAFRLPEEADHIIEADHPFFAEVARDLADLCHHPDAGELIILGWKKGPRSLTFPAERGAHAGPGPAETSGFALLPYDALPRSAGAFLKTADLRQACFRAMKRGDSGAFWDRGARQKHASILRVMTYNVHGCMGRDGKISPDRIARIIARQDPDLVALQELDVADNEHQAEIISEKLVMTYHYQPVFKIKKGQHGNAIFSRFPVRPIRLGSLPKMSASRLLEPRGAMWVEIDFNGKKVQIINTHLSISSTEGYLQVKALLGPDWMGNPACRGPVVVCGDFNALTDSRICKELSLTLKNSQLDLSGHRPAKTLPSYFPLGIVDHIFTGSGVRTDKIEAPRTALERIASDHLPLIVDLEIL